MNVNQRSLVKDEAFEPDSPSPGQVILWWMAVTNVPEETLSSWLQLLDQEERSRAARFHFSADRRQFVAAHGLMRIMLARHGGGHPEHLRFRRAKGGRPELVGSSDLRFSLSHTRGVVACAVARTDAVGMDVESRLRTDRGQDIAESFFSAVEVELIRQRGQEAFLRLWTLKEAYLKATGEGLARALDSFSFSLDPIRIDDRETQQAWAFEHITTIPGHLAAVALPWAGTHPFSVETREVDPAELSKYWTPSDSGADCQIREPDYESV